MLENLQIMHLITSDLRNRRCNKNLVIVSKSNKFRFEPCQLAKSNEYRFER